jgi:hypothetical protein
VRLLDDMETVDTETVGRSDETVLSRNENFELGAKPEAQTSPEVATDLRTEVSSAELKEWLELCGSVHDLSQTLTEQVSIFINSDQKKFGQKVFGHKVWDKFFITF